MKKIITRALALLLSCCLLAISTVGNCQNVQASAIVAGGALVGSLEEILLSFGIFLLPASAADSAQNSDWWYSEDGNAALKPYYDDLSSEYEKERFKVINGGGGDPQPSPTPDPGTTPEPGVTPVPGEIPTFDELVAPALAGGAISWASGAWDTMAKAVSNLWDKMFNRFDYEKCNLSDVGSDFQDIIISNSSSYPYYLFTEAKLSGRYYRNLYFFGNGCSLYGDQSYTHHYVYFGKLYHYLQYENNPIADNGFISSAKPNNSAVDGQKYSTNLPCFDTIDESKKYAENFISNEGKYTKENIWVHPDLQNTYQNNGKLEYPQQAPQPLQYPSAENLADLARKLNPEINPDYSPEIAPNYVQELIQKLQQNPSVNPDPNPNPNPDPNPNPNPDPGTDPQPTVKPNPTSTPEQPENPEDEVKPYTVDLTKVFPFCIPFDLIHLFEVLDAEPEAPVFKIPIDLQVDNPFNGKNIVSYNDTIVIDLSDYEQPVKVIRVFEIIFFLIGLMLITRSHMIKG